MQQQTSAASQLSWGFSLSAPLLDLSLKDGVLLLQVNEGQISFNGLKATE